MRLPSLKRFMRRQQSFIAIAVAIYAGLWAVDRRPDISVTLAYTLPLCNLIVLVKDRLGFLYERKPVLRSLATCIALLFVIAIAGVGVVNAIVYALNRPPSQTLWQFLKSGWKLPFTATMIVGVCRQLYDRARERLESRNRELQRNLEREAAERELQGQEMQQAREIQQSLLPREIPQVPGFEIDCAWEPARIVGGDYFDVIPLSQTKLGICIADVVQERLSSVADGQRAGQRPRLRWRIALPPVQQGQLGVVLEHRCGKICHAVLRRPRCRAPHIPLHQCWTSFADFDAFRRSRAET